MKTPIPVTLDDLQATAKDNKRGWCTYGSLKIYWDGATNKHNYWFKDEVIDAGQVKDILNEH